METNPTRMAAAEVIAYGTVGTLMDLALEIIKEITDDLTEEFQYLTDEIYHRFGNAENKLIDLTEERGVTDVIPNGEG